MENVDLTPQGEAQEIIRLAKEAQERQASFVEKLKQARADINAALVELGVEKRAVGRPAGKRARKAKAQFTQEQPNA